jgi:RHS repeat-associated protein
VTTSVTYAHDNNGNATSKTDSTGTTQYAWDFENRLTSVTLPGTGGTVSFKYDPFGRRIYKSSASGTSVFAYDWDNLIEETNAAGAVVARYAQTETIDEPLAMLRSAATSYYHTDGLGSVTSLSNAAGALAQTYTYDSFGKQTASSGSLTNPFQYTAREADSETNLQFSRARYYDHNIGKFLSEDPIRFKAGVNFYQYVDNSPASGTDPLGLKTCIWTGNVDLYTSTDWVNKRYDKWVMDSPFKEGGPSRAPFGGGESSAPAGVNNRVGVPAAVMVCQWHRDIIFDEIETTYFVKTYICFDTDSCGKTRFWPEFEFAKRTRFLGPRKSGFRDTYDSQRCKSLGPPNR